MTFGKQMKLLAIATLFLPVVAGLAVFAGPAAAETVCARMEQIAAGLAQGYGEAPVSRGLMPSGQLLVVFAAPDGATFTLIIVSAAGVGCVGASGTGWQSIVPAPKGEPS